MLPLLLIGNSSPCGGSGFPLSLSESSFTTCPTPYNRKENVLSVLLNKTFFISYFTNYQQGIFYVHNRIVHTTDFDTPAMER